MQARLKASTLAGLLALFSGLSAAAQCNLAQVPGAGVPGTPVYAAENGLPSLYFHSDMDVNTDGSARSYHPQDPRGRNLALNNVGNAISAMYNPQGQRTDCEPRQGSCFERYISTFEAARAAEWNPVGHPRIETRNIIPWRMDSAVGRRVPCTIQQGPFTGYFISQTSAIANPSLGECNQSRYLNSLMINAVVLPSGAAWSSLGIVLDEYDVVVVRDRASNHVRFAIIGDRGPPGKMGEGSIALAASLSARQLTGRETYQEIKSLALPDVDYVLFPTFDVRKVAVR